MRWINWGVAVAVVYALFAASTLGFVAFAMSRPVQLVSPDYYERSLQHDQRAAAAGRARGLGARLHVVLDDRAGVLDVTLPRDAAAGAAGAITFYRPSDSRADRTIALALDAAGRQRVPVAALARGRWLARIEWAADGRAYFHETGLVLR
jgi:nitrogen fixation protein FixH